MMTRRILAVTLAAVVALGVSPAMAQQAGIISGKATDEAKQPYTDYTVQLRDTATGQVVGTVPLNAQGAFSFNSVDFGKRLLVELYNTKQNSVVCTEGPYNVNSSANRRNDVNIDCGKTPAALWLLTAGAGTAAAIAIAQRSGSQ